MSYYDDNENLPAFGLDVETPLNKSRFCEAVDLEAISARKQHPPIHSLHEGLSVIWEEFEEFKVEVFKKDSQRDRRNMLTELIQIAAMCKKTAEDCGLI